MTPQSTLEQLRAAVQAEIDGEIARQRTVLAPLGSSVDPMVDAIESLLSGGKRLRAAFCHLGYLAAGGTHVDASVRAATAMEFFQAAALLHDDVMDDSDTRRGAPAAHRALASTHAGQGWSGASDRYGQAGAILAGDLCLVWCDSVFATSGLPTAELARARGEYDAMRTQLMGGQFVEVTFSARGWDDLDTAGRLDAASHVIRYKSAKYSIEQPLLIGARAGGAGDEALRELSAYGLALGEAFQLRDDVLGVWGDPATTGKPAGDDIREGKLTMLVAYALDTATPEQAAVLRDALGRADLDPAALEDVRATLRGTGAVDRIEERITELTQRARTHLAAAPDLVSQAKAVLDHLVDATTARTS